MSATVGHQPWCEVVDHVDDGVTSCYSRDREVGGLALWLAEREAGVVVAFDLPRDLELTMPDAQAFAQHLLALVKAARV